MLYNVEMTIRDNDGSLLTVNESRHTKWIAALSHADKCARDYAARYPGSSIRKCVGGFFLVIRRELTIAQFAIR